jgi:hypothetical protein
MLSNQKRKKTNVINALRFRGTKGTERCRCGGEAFIHFHLAVCSLVWSLVVVFICCCCCCRRFDSRAIPSSHVPFLLLTPDEEEPEVVVSQPFFVNKSLSVSTDFKWNSSDNPCDVFQFLEEIGVGYDCNRDALMVTRLW